VLLLAKLIFNLVFLILHQLYHYLTMPKEKMSVTYRLKSYVSEFGANTFTINASVLLCKCCDIKINHEKRFNITQHLKTEKHLNAIKPTEIVCDKKKTTVSH